MYHKGVTKFLSKDEEKSGFLWYYLRAGEEGQEILYQLGWNIGHTSLSQEVDQRRQANDDRNHFSLQTSGQRTARKDRRTQSPILHSW